MLLQVDDCKNSWIWIIKHIFLISEKTLLNILDTFLCKIIKRKLKCIFKLCAAIWQDFEHPKNRPPISLSHTIECVWERRTSMFLVLDTNLWFEIIFLLFFSNFDLCIYRLQSSLISLETQFVVLRSCHR